MAQNQQEQTEAKLLAYIEGELDEAGRAEIDRHLAANPNHRRMLDDLAEGRKLLRFLPREQAPPELLEAFQSQMERSLLLDDAVGTGAAAGVLRIALWSKIRSIAAVLFLAAGLGMVVYYALPSRRAPVAISPAASQDRGMAERSEEMSRKADAVDAAPPITVVPEDDADKAPAGETSAGVAAMPRMSKGAAPDVDEVAKSFLPREGEAGGTAALPAVEQATMESTLRYVADNFAVRDAVRNGSISAYVNNGVAGQLRQGGAGRAGARRELSKAAPAQAAVPPAATMPAAPAAPQTAGAEPLYVVVNTPDPGQAREQISAYLQSNSIRCDLVDPQVFQPAPAANVARNPGVESPASPAAGPTAERRMAAKHAAPARPAPNAAAPAGAPPVTQPAQQQAVAEVSPSPARVPAPGDAGQPIEELIIARGMNRRQAMDLRGNVHRPADAQWAAVFEQPADARNLKDAVGGGGGGTGGAGARQVPGQGTGFGGAAKPAAVANDAALAAPVARPGYASKIGPTTRGGFKSEASTAPSLPTRANESVQVLGAPVGGEPAAAAPSPRPNDGTVVAQSSATRPADTEQPSAPVDEKWQMLTERTGIANAAVSQQQQKQQDGDPEDSPVDVVIVVQKVAAPVPSAATPPAAEMEKAKAK